MEGSFVMVVAKFMSPFCRIESFMAKSGIKSKISNRVSQKKQSSFLWPGNLNLAVFRRPNQKKDTTFCRQLRLGICQKIYTTQFLGEKILHTENA